MKLLLSSYSLEPFPLEETFLLAKEIGADGVELVLTPAVFGLGLKRVRELAQKHGAPVVNVHQAPWWVLFTGKRGINSLLEKTMFLGAENAVVHLATLRRGRGSRFFDWIKKRERETGVNIALENAAPRLLERWPSYGSRPEELKKFVKARGVNLTLDVSKLSLTGEDPHQFFQAAREFIKVMHLHGFNGDNYHIGLDGGNFDWPGFVSFAKKFDCRAAVTLEIFPMASWIRFSLPPRERLEKTKEILRDNFAVLKRALL